MQMPASAIGGAKLRRVCKVRTLDHVAPETEIRPK